jgi:hypothetical protein
MSERALRTERLAADSFLQIHSEQRRLRLLLLVVAAARNESLQSHYSLLLATHYLHAPRLFL